MFAFRQKNREQSQDNCKTQSCHLGKEETREHKASAQSYGKEGQHSLKPLQSFEWVLKSQGRNRTTQLLNYKRTRQRRSINGFLYSLSRSIKWPSVSNSGNRNQNLHWVGKEGSVVSTEPCPISAFFPDVSNKEPQRMLKAGQCRGSSVLYSCWGHFRFSNMAGMYTGHSCHHPAG